MVDSDPSVRTNMPVVTEYSIWQNARNGPKRGILLLPPPLVFCLIQESQFSYAVRKGELASQNLELVSVACACACAITKAESSEQQKWLAGRDG